MNETAGLSQRISRLIRAAGQDPVRTREFFEYVWTMVCVRRGLFRLIEDAGPGPAGIVVEEAYSRERRIVARPPGLDPEVEQLAIDAMARMLES